MKKPRKETKRLKTAEVIKLADLLRLEKQPLRLADFVARHPEFSRGGILHTCHALGIKLQGPGAYFFRGRDTEVVTLVSKGLCASVRYARPKGTQPKMLTPEQKEAIKPLLAELCDRVAELLK
jgi:hypothetical protein